jgi:hypothetical protein
MARVLLTIIFLSVIVSVASQSFLVHPTKQTQKVEIDSSKNWFVRFFNFVKSLALTVKERFKTADGDKLNKRNICDWIICSKPLKEKKALTKEEMLQYKDFLLFSSAQRTSLKNRF